MLVVVGLGAGAAEDGYLVRAVFDNAAFVVPGEDVKIAGAKVGVVTSMDVTADKKAAVTLLIEDPRFAPFRADATCTIRPQSLIGEKFVECDPGTSKRSELARIARGDGEGEHLLALARTSSPVDLDLINNILRRPYRERLSILLNELGTGVAGRGEDLEAVIRRANPALRETDRVLAILARQNRVLAKLATDSDRALVPLARARRQVTGFVRQANETAEATATRRDDIEGTIQRLPAFLAELDPLMQDLDTFATDATPVARDLNAAAPQVSRLVKQLGPFTEAATPSLVTLGRAAERGRPALIRTRPLLRDLGRFAADARPVSRNLDELTASLERTGGIERLMDLIFYSALSINGFDEIGHYLRAGLLVNLCTSYAIEPAGGCESNFTATRAVGSGTASAASSGSELRANLADDEASRARGSVPDPEGGLLGGVLGAGSTMESSPSAQRIRERDGQTPGRGGVDEPMLDYLLGGEE